MRARPEWKQRHASHRSGCIPCGSWSAALISVHTPQPMPYSALLMHVELPRRSLLLGSQ